VAPPGRRSDDYDDKRDALAHKLFQLLIEDGSTSLAAMADHAGVSRPTIRHYFGDRDGAVRAALEAGARVGEPFVSGLAALPVDDPHDTLRTALRQIVEGWRRYGVGRIHAAGLRIGLEDEATGSTYVAQILEPMLGAFETILTRLVEAGRLGPLEPRYGALALASPVVVALLHQDGLGGAALRPLDLDALIERLVDDLCRAWPAPG